MNTILIIEDDTSLANGLVRALSSEENVAESCNSLHWARHKLKHNNYSLVLLDVNLPDGNGFDFLAELKENYDIPVIILTANDLETDIVAGLEQGAVDYITKPFSLAILRARVNAQLRRILPSGPVVSPDSQKQRYICDDYLFDFGKMQFTYNGTQIDLSKTEQKLLRILTENAGITLSRNTLIDFIWTDGADYVDENALSVAIKRLRDKLSAQDYIKTVYGIGYVWDKNAVLNYRSV